MNTTLQMQMEDLREEARRLQREENMGHNMNGYRAAEKLFHAAKAIEEALRVLELEGIETF